MQNTTIENDATSGQKLDVRLVKAGDGWKISIPSTLYPGKRTLSLRVYPTKAKARRAARVWRNLESKN